MLLANAQLSSHRLQAYIDVQLDVSADDFTVRRAPLYPHEFLTSAPVRVSSIQMFTINRYSPVTEPPLLTTKLKT